MAKLKLEIRSLALVQKLKI